MKPGLTTALYIKEGGNTQKQCFAVVRAFKSWLQAVHLLFAIIILLAFALCSLHLPICEVLRVGRKKSIRGWVDFTSPREVRDVKLVKNLSA